MGNKIETGEAQPSDFRDSSISQKFQLYHDSNLFHSHENGTPRVCFLSLFYLFGDWKSIPFDTLAHSIIILNCDRNWIFKNRSVRTQSDASESSDSDGNMDNAADNDDTDTDSDSANPIRKRIQQLKISDSFEFKAFLLNKEKQGRLFWIDESVHWNDISQWLSIHSDPMTHLNYHSLIVNSNWWHHKFHREIMTLCTSPRDEPSDGGDNDEIDSDYDTYTRSIVQSLVVADECKSSTRVPGYEQLTEIEHCDSVQKIYKELLQPQWSFPVFQEVLHQSNPTLIPMARWNEKTFLIKNGQITKVMTSAESMIDIRSKSHSILPFLSSVDGPPMLKLRSIDSSTNGAETTVSPRVIHQPSTAEEAAAIAATVATTIGTAIGTTIDDTVIINHSSEDTVTPTPTLRVQFGLEDEEDGTVYLA